ncbi:hypothetical protein E4U37_003257 [Claviceps purpurea]|nr:hypothetical protein E4U37_003257 [Claviceps purpurea]
MPIHCLTKPDLRTDAGCFLIRNSTIPHPNLRKDAGCLLLRSSTIPHLKESFTRPPPVPAVISRDTRQSSVGSTRQCARCSYILPVSHFASVRRPSALTKACARCRDSDRRVPRQPTTEPENIAHEGSTRQCSKCSHTLPISHFASAWDG